MTTQPTNEPSANAAPEPASDQYSQFFAARDQLEGARLEVNDFEILLGQRPPAEEAPPEPTPTPTPTPTPSAADPSVAEPAPGASPTPAPAAPPAAPTAAPPAAAEPSEVELLRQTVAQMQAKINELSAPKPPASGNTPPAGGGNPQPTTGTAPSAGDPPADPLPEYLVQVPDQLVEDLSDDDPAKRKQALMGLIAGVGKLVHQQMRAEYRPYIEAQLGQFRQRSAQESNEEVIRNDFFTAFPHLNKPEYMVTLGLVMQQVLTETGAKSWTQEVRDAVGARMNRLINHQPAPAADPAQGGGTPPTSAPAAPAAPSLVSPRSAPPSRPAPTGDLSAEIMETLR